MRRNEIWPIFIPGYNAIGSVATFDKLEREMPVPTRIDEAGGVRHEHAPVAGEEVLDATPVRPYLEIEDALRRHRCRALDDDVPHEIALDESIEALELRRALSAPRRRRAADAASRLEPRPCRICARCC